MEKLDYLVFFLKAFEVEIQSRFQSLPMCFQSAAFGKSVVKSVKEGPGVGHYKGH